MYKEIGSEFWIDNLDLNKKLNINKNNISHFDKFGTLYLTKSGRGALHLLLDKIDIKTKVALLPSYICDSIIKPFVSRGFECKFYDINLNLTPEFYNTDFNNIGIFLHIGYFGFNTNKYIDLILEKLKKQGTVIVEDITHKLYSNYSFSSYNDYYIASLRKWCGLPSGGFLSSTQNLEIDIDEKSSENMNAFIQRRLKAMLLKGDYILNDAIVDKTLILDLLRDSEQILDNSYDFSRIDNISLELYNSLDIELMIKKRKKNYEFLNRYLIENENIIPVVGKLEPETCPLFYPIYVENYRDKLRDNLKENNIYCPIHWQKPLILNDQTMKSNYIYDHILSIPCDQRYGIDDMERIVEVIKKY